jgi:GT2 family glycosyltransferase
VWLDHQLGHNERQLAGTPLASATIAICTRERPDDLRRALAGIARQVGLEHDVLVVDNGPPTTATREVVAEFGGVRYVCEPRRGLNAARNRALAEARGDIVAFCDDDAVPEPEWLAALAANFADPRVMCATGLTLPIELETEAQELFEQYSPFAKGFRRRVFDWERHNPLMAGQVGAGANMALRRGVAALVGGFDERLDGGMPTRSGGDHEMFIRLLTAGYRIAYDPAAVSWHRHRRTMDDVVDTVYG